MTRKASDDVLHFHVSASGKIRPKRKGKNEKRSGGKIKINNTYPCGQQQARTRGREGARKRPLEGAICARMLMKRGRELCGLRIRVTLKLTIDLFDLYGVRG